jgi:hypoxia up-regulated 1
MLSAASDWIYAEGHDAAEAVLKTRLKDLKGLVDPIMKRKGETSGRPEAVKELEAAIADLKSVITIVNDGIKSASAASAASSKSVEELSKSAASSTSASASTTPSADAADDLDDDSFSSSSSSLSAAPLPTEVVNIYTPEDLQTIESTVEKSTAWLQEKKVAQEKLQGHEDAAFSIQEVKAEAKKVNDLVTKMMTRKFNVLNEQQAKKEQLEREAKAKSKAARKAAAKKSKKGKKNTEKGKEGKEGKMPSDEELKEAMEKAGVKGEGIKVEGLRGLKDLKGKDGKPLIQLDLGDDASDEDILEAVRKMGGGKGHDEL